MLKLKKILYPTDFSRCADQVFYRALYLAKKYQAELHLLHVIVLHDDDPHNPAYHFPDIEEVHEKLKQLADDRMDTVMTSHQTDSVKIKKIKDRGIAPAPSILEYAHKKSIDLIIMGTHGRRGLGHLFLGSVSEEVVRLAECPVLTIHEQKEPAALEALGSVLVPIDFSDCALYALTYAKEIAAVFETRLQLLHVVEESIHPAFYVTGKSSIFELIPDIKDKSEQQMRQLLKKSKGPDVKADFHVVEGNASQEIIKFAKSHSSGLIVIATHGLTGLKHLLLGSVAEKVVRMATCPVLTVKPFGKSLLAK